LFREGISGTHRREKLLFSARCYQVSESRTNIGVNTAMGTWAWGRITKKEKSRLVNRRRGTVGRQTSKSCADLWLRKKDR